MSWNEVHHLLVPSQEKACVCVTKVCGPTVGNSNFRQFWPLGQIGELSHLVSNCESQRLSFQVPESKLEMQKLKEVKV